MTGESASLNDATPRLTAARAQPQIALPSGAGLGRRRDAPGRVTPGVKHLLVMKLEERAACIGIILATPFVDFVAYLSPVARAHESVTVAIRGFNLAPPVQGAPVECLYLC